MSVNGRQRSMMFCWFSVGVGRSGLLTPKQGAVFIVLWTPPSIKGLQSNDINLVRATNILHSHSPGGKANCETKLTSCMVSVQAKQKN